MLALRHQHAVLQRQAPRRLRLGRSDRFLWVLLSRLWPHWRGKQSRSSRLPRSCAGIGAGSRSAGGGSPDRDAWPPSRVGRHPDADPADACGQPALGRPRVFTASCRSSGSRGHSRPWRSTLDCVTAPCPYRESRTCLPPFEVVARRTADGTSRWVRRRNAQPRMRSSMSPSRSSAIA